jgi:hypothetical protein
MAQTVECLPSKGETLSSNPSMAKKEKERKTNTRLLTKTL